MTKTLPYAALAAAFCAIAGTSLAQTPAPGAPAQPGSPATTSATTPSSPAPSSATSSATPSTTNPPTAPSAAPSSAPAGAAPTGSSTDTTAHAGSATLMTGMSVKDNTGALIGEVKSIKGGVATISMGSSTFTVDSDKLGVTNGAATINATQAEIKGMLPKK